MKKCSAFAVVLLIPPLFGFSNPLDKGRFGVELFYGFSTLKPADLNLRAETDLELRQFIFEHNYNWAKERGIIRNYKATYNGEFPEIRDAVLNGFRLRCRVSRTLDVSLGYKWVGRTETTAPTSTYIVVDQNLVVTKETNNYNHYSLSAKGHCPILGVHWRPVPSDTIPLEIFLSAGLIFARCSYSFDKAYILRSAAYPGILDYSFWKVEEKGHGVGVSLEAGGRLGFKVFGKGEIFCEAGYTYQGLRNPFGKGSQVLNGEASSWEGEWAMKEFFTYGYTGNLTFEFPSNSWEGEEYLRVRDFILDLSGVFLRFGVSYRF